MLLFELFLFSRPPIQPAVKVNLGENLYLEEVVKDACTQLGIKIPDVVVLHSEPRLYVFHGHITVFDGVTKGRALSIGLPLIKALSMNELKA